MGQRQSDWRQLDRPAAELPVNHLAWLHTMLHESSVDPWESVDHAFQRTLQRAPDAPGRRWP